MDKEEALGKVFHDFGFEALKEKQRETVLSFLNGNDVFVSLPTGYGKSLIYGVLPVVFDLMKGKFL